MSDRFKNINKEINEEIKSLDELPPNPQELFSSLVNEEEERDEKDEVIKLLFELEDTRKIADITHNQMIDIVVLDTFQNWIKSPLIKHFFDSFLKLSLSKGRKSRQEIVDIYKTNIFGDIGDIEQPNKKGFFQRQKERLIS